jgi:hypothetical protein
MVALTALWLPILVAAILVFLVSSLLHMVLPWHKGDVKQLPGEESVMAAIRDAKVPPGDYMFPHCDQKEMGSPEAKAKFERGPVGTMTVMPSGMPFMGAILAHWFAYSVVVGIFVAYVTGRVHGPGADYLQVFRIAGAVAFLAYAGSEAQRSIWWGRSWATTARNVIDGLVYGLVTAGAFGWLWPR